MNLKATKTPILIAAMATAVTLTTFLPANAKAYWVSADPLSVETIKADDKVTVTKTAERITGPSNHTSSSKI